MKKETINKKKKILIVIPAYNEEMNIDKVLKSVKKDVGFADILVVNDGSTDNTRKIVLDNGVKCIDNIFNMDSSFAIQTGIKYAYENDYDYVIQMDADGQHIAKEATKLYETIIKEDVDVVIGSRYLEDLGYKGPQLRRWGTKIFEKLIKFFCKEKITDSLSGFRCYNKGVIKLLANYDNYLEYMDANFIIKLLQNDYKIKEIPVIMLPRSSGRSKFKGIIMPIKYMVKMFYIIFFTVIFKPKRK